MNPDLNTIGLDAQPTVNVDLDNTPMLPDKATLLKWLAAYDKSVDRGVIGAQRAIAAGLGHTPGLPLEAAARMGKFAGGPIGRNILRVVPAVGTVIGLGGTGNVLLGGESGANKAMDALAMLGAGTAGYRGMRGRGKIGRTVGALAGAGGAKMGSDSLQWLFGDKMSAEEREVANALAALRGGVV